LSNSTGQGNGIATGIAAFGSELLDGVRIGSAIHALIHLAAMIAQLIHRDLEDIATDLTRVGNPAGFEMLEAGDDRGIQNVLRQLLVTQLPTQ
jgi:hypothetical protein